MIKTKEEIIATVTKYLNQSQNGHVKLRIIVDAVRCEDDWWYVPVKPDRTLRSYDYYGILGEIEEKIDDDLGLNVLLVPAAPED